MRVGMAVDLYSGMAGADGGALASLDFSNGVYRRGRTLTSVLANLPGYSAAATPSITPGVGYTVNGADSLSITGLVIPKRVTIVVWATPTSLPASSTGPAHLTDGGVGNRLTIYRQTGTNLINGYTSTTTTNQALSSGNTAQANVQFRGALAADGSNARFSGNGSSVVGSNAGAQNVDPTILNVLNIGHLAGTAQFAGTIQRIDVLRGAAGDSRLQDLAKL